jgi:hypothetical protein
VTTFVTAVERLINQVGHWEQARWWSRTEDGSTRGDLAFGLIQRLADAGADAEERPRRPVPRLSDIYLTDQLRVMTDDLIAADAGADLVDEVDATRRALG